MKLLLHTCCGPCSIYPIELLRQDHQISALFFNPNIHPYQEFKRRQETFLAFCSRESIPVLDTGRYGLEEYLRRVIHNEHRRCRICYSWRMEETARIAAEEGFAGFSTTLLYSRYQDHEELKRCGYALAEKYRVDFFYQDFRDGWQYGIVRSKELNMYRQPYCGCIYSEYERYGAPKHR